MRLLALILVLNSTIAVAEIKIVASAAQNLSKPMDLDFNPATGDLWVVNQAYSGVVIIHKPGLADQTSERRIDSPHGPRHFMKSVAAVAFSDTEFFSSCQDNTDDFMGPTLWKASIFAKVNQNGGPFGKLGSHMDMLHASPQCVGIAHEKDNAYWVFDGRNSELVRYDFQHDHGAGNSDHSDGIVRRYIDVSLKRLSGSHSGIYYQHGQMTFDDFVDAGVLYIADTGNNRVLKVDSTTARFHKSLPKDTEPLAEYSEYTGSTVTVLANLTAPTGLDYYGGKLYVAAGSGIHVYEDGIEINYIELHAVKIQGIKVNADGIWYTDSQANQVGWYKE